MKQINRRNFLATSAAFSAFTILKPATVFGSKANSAIRVGIIGCGNRGTEVLSEMIKNTAAQTVAMADLFGYQIEKAKPVFDKVNIDRGGVAIDKSKIYQGSEAYQRLLNDSAIDAVLISSPAYTHPGFLEAAVLAGKHVYCEKPAAPDVAGCKKVIEAGEKASGKVSVAIGFQIRHASPYVEMANRIWKGDIGEVVNVQLHYISSGGKKVEPVGSSIEEFKIRNHFHFTELSGGIFLDQAIHMIDVCNWVLNEKPENAVGKGNRKGEPDFGDTFTNYQVIFEYPQYKNVSVHSTQLGAAFGDVCARFLGTKGIAEAHYSLGVFIKGENPWDSGVLHGQEPTPEQRAAGVFTSALYDSTPNKVKAFINSIETGNLINEARSGATSTLSAILGRMSAETHKETSWDEMVNSGQKYNLNLNLKQFDN
ncbi:MAG TPA: Gfo/Idh/MocA family oxidoreductase [Draconibacterium sp.]|nr:Gfo/Idh/MocA family oxidoreductase [Draconibacterium sp.]